MFPDDAVAEHWFVKTRWPGGVHCPCCGSLNVQERETRKPQPYRCRDCRKDFSVKLGTLMGRVKTRISDLGDGDLPDDDGTQGYVQHEASP